MDVTNAIIPELSINTIKSLMTSEEYSRYPHLSVFLNWPSKLRIHGGKIVNWVKKDNDLVKEGEQIVIISFTFSSIISSLPISLEIALKANDSGVLKILVTSAMPIEEGTVIARIEEINELDKHLVSRQDQLISQLSLSSVLCK